MRTVELSKIFDVEYGNSLELNRLIICEIDNPKRVNFVSRTRENNGISAYVEEVEGLTPFEEGLITVAGSGNSVLESFIQSSKFYTGYHVFILRPRQNLSLEQKLFYCYCIRQNQYKFSYGRQANRTIKKLLLPQIDEIPGWVYEDLNIKAPSKKPIHQKEVSIKDREWHSFSLKDLFPKLEKCKCTNATNLLTEGDDINYIGAKKTDNGFMQRVQMIEKLVSRGNTIVFIGDGAGSVGYVTYQKKDFIGSSTLTCGYNKYLNEYIGLFLVTVLDLERYRFSFGRKYGKKQIQNMKIKLPSTNSGEPDWAFMEYYIKSLPYSSALEDENKSTMGKLKQVQKIEKNSGLSDEELVKKYESGSIDLESTIKPMLKKAT